MCEEENPFIPRIRNFESSRKTRMPNNVKTYDGTGDPEDHVKVFQAAAQVERWAMPTWCHMFNSTLIGAARVWFDELPPESIDGYKDLRAAFLAYFMQQKKYVKDLVEIHNIKQRDGETIEDFIERFKTETGCMKGAPECMRISGFMHEVNNPELTKRLNEHVPKTMEEITTTAFIRGEAAAASNKKDKRSDFRGHSREGRGSNRFTPLTRTPKEILATEASKFQPLPPMVTPIEKRSNNKFSSNETKGPLVIEAEMGRHVIHRMYIDGATTSLPGFSSETIWPLGQLRLLVIIGDATHSTKAWINFMVMKSLSLYNGIIGRPRLKAIQAVPSTVHGMLKFPVKGGIVTIYSIILIPTECASVITSPVIPREEKAHPANFKVALHPDFPNQEVVIGGTLSDKGRTELCSVLKKNFDILAWQPSDMTGVPCWRMCVEFTYLNKTRPQDCYPLPKIDWKVESREDNFPHGTGDDLVVKIYTEAEMMRDIEETFRTLRKVNMKLNQKKCSFGLAEGVFLGTRLQAVEAALIRTTPIGRTGFTTFSISQVPRSKNKKADALSKIASTSFSHLSKQVLVEVLENKSIKEKEVVAVIEEDGPTWMTQLVDYLKGGVLSGDK
nr:reverse transcriptase domain-containing protein [Tanacetum cinerariifolium]